MWVGFSEMHIEKPKFEEEEAKVLLIDSLQSVRHWGKKGSGTQLSDIHVMLDDHQRDVLDSLFSWISSTNGSIYITKFDNILEYYTTKFDTLSPLKGSHRFTVIKF